MVWAPLRGHTDKGKGNAVNAIIEAVTEGRANVESFDQIRDRLRVALQDQGQKFINGMVSTERLMKMEEMQPDPQQVELARAVRNGDVVRAKELIDSGSEVVLTRIRNGSGLLADCVQWNQMDILQLLLDHGAPVELRETMSDGLSKACSVGNPEAARRMIAAGAPLKIERDGDLLSVPVRIAVSCNHLDVVKVLVEAGAAVNGLWNNGTNLSLAVNKGYHEIAEYLRSKGGKMPHELVRDKLGSEPETLHDETIVQFTLHFGFPLPDAQHSLVPQETPVSIHVIPRNPNSGYITLFTNGLADQPMHTPEGQEEWSRAELYMQLPEDWKIDMANNPIWGWPFQWLREIAQLPARNTTWFGGKVCIIDLGELTPGLRFRGCFMHAERFYQSTTYPGTIVTMYRVIPLTVHELEFERQHGTENLLTAMDLVDVPPVVDINRVDAAT